MPSSTDRDKKVKKPFRLQEQIEWIAMAFVLALTVRCFVVEAYQIPTGSMAPTLYGKHVEVKCDSCGALFSVRGADGADFLANSTCPSCGAQTPPQRGPIRIRGGDRILVAKDLYGLKAPRRWDVFVFKSPEADKHNTNFVKRLIGLPGERIEIRGGQVFVNDLISRKPPLVQEELWQPVYDWDATDPDDYWKPSGEWRVQPEGLLLASRGEAVHTVQYDRPILDFYPYNGREGENLVTDVLVSGHVKIESDGGSFTAAVSDDGGTAKAVFTPIGGMLSVQLRKNERTIRDIASKPPVASDFDFSLASVDGAVEVCVNGISIARTEEPLTSEDVPLAAGVGGVFFQGTLSRMLVSGVELKRDVYYRISLRRPDRAAREPFVEDIPEGCFFGLGDNSPISNDSREWHCIPEGNVLGKAFFLFWPPQRVKPVH